MFKPRCCLFYWIFTSALLCTADLTSAVCLIWNNWCQTKRVTPLRFIFFKSPPKKRSDGEKKPQFNGCFTDHVFQRKQNIHVFHEIDIRAQRFRCHSTLQGMAREWLPSLKQRGLKSSLKYLPLVPRGSRETRECFSALILKVQVHEGKNSSDCGGIVFFKLLHLGKCAYHLKHLICEEKTTGYT